jgi:hypothetical protein
LTGLVHDVPAIISPPNMTGHYFAKEIYLGQYSTNGPLVLMFDLRVIQGAGRRSLLGHLTPFFKRLAIIVNFGSNGGQIWRVSQYLADK